MKPGTLQFAMAITEVSQLCVKHLQAREKLDPHYTVNVSYDYGSHPDVGVVRFTFERNDGAPPVVEKEAVLNPLCNLCTRFNTPCERCDCPV